MKIVHIAVLAPYNEGWGYQENLLPKYQVKLGHEVALITTCKENAGKGTIHHVLPSDTVNADGVRVIRLEKTKILSKKITDLLDSYAVYDYLKEICPDFIMIHGLGNVTALQVKKYVKKINPVCVVVADNHLDENNCEILISKKFRHRLVLLWQRCICAKMRSVFRNVYGVTPKRARISDSLMGYSSPKALVFSAGADDEKICFSNWEKIRREIRQKHDVEEDDFLIVTGGKIDEKKGIHTLMEAVIAMKDPRVKLIVFGMPTDSIRETVESLSKNERIRFIGWIPSDKTYDYFLAADLAVFPGLHSVMWEQACACKIPCVFHKIDGIDHLDVGGNCLFIEEPSRYGLEDCLSRLIFTDRYEEMKRIARSDRTDAFLYGNLAKRIIEENTACE